MKHFNFDACFVVLLSDFARDTFPAKLVSK